MAPLRRPIGWCVFSTLVAGFVPVPASAQHLSITPQIGVYVPTAELIKAASGQEFKQEVSITVGGRLGLWFGRRIGIEAAGNYAPSDLTVSTSGVGSTTQEANIFTGSGQLFVFVIPETSPFSLVLTGGVGVVNRSGDYYASAEDKTDIGGTVGAIGRIRLGQVLWLQVGVEDLIYKTKAFTEDLNVDGEQQNDLQLSLGLGIPFLGLGAQR